MDTLTFKQYLAIPADYRSVSEFRARRLVRSEQGATLEPVRISDSLTRTREGDTPDGYLVAKATAYALGEQVPHFSLTGELWKSERHYRNDWEQSGFISGGAMGEEIAARWPEFAIIERLHLADAITGEPMHALANGWYFYSQGDHDAAARALRVPSEELPTELDEVAFREFAISQRARWAEEAEQGRAFLRWDS